jgi:hypothetical protein
MPIQTVNLGSYANDGTGDDLRTAFEKVNANFTLLNTEINIGNAANIGSGTGIFAQKNSLNLEFKTLTSDDSTVSITHTATTVNLESTAKVESDTDPHLGGDLYLNGYIINGGNGTGDVQSTVHGIDIRTVNALLEIAISTNTVDLEFGSNSSALEFQTTPLIDLGSFEFPSTTNLDFGRII